MTTTFEAEALAEYHEAAQYSEDRFGLGRQFVAAVQAAFTTIEKVPDRFQPVGQGIHIFRMKRFPFYHFHAEQESIVVYAVAHHRRKSGYWRDRPPE